MASHPRQKRIKIYATRWHLLATLSFILLPVVFLLIFSQAAHLGKGILFENLLASLARILIAYIISAILAWTLAVTFFRGKRSNIALPIFDVLQSLPTFALMPIAILYFGRNNFTIILFLVLAIIWPLLFSLISTLKLVKTEWEEAVAISHLKGFAYLMKFIIPASLPGLITGSIIGLGDGWEALIATEIIIGVNAGLGNFFQKFSADTAVTAFGVLGLLLVIFTINKLIWLPLLNMAHAKWEE